MGHPPKGHQMVRANAMHRDATDDDHVAPAVLEPVAQGLCRIALIAPEQSLLPEFSDPLGGSVHVWRLRRQARSTQEFVDRPLESGAIEGPDPRNAAGTGAFRPVCVRTGGRVVAQHGSERVGREIGQS